MKIAYKISLAFLISTIVLVVVAMSVFYNFARVNLEEAIFNNLSTAIKSRVAHIESFLKMGANSVEQLSKSIVIKQLLSTNKEDEDYQQKFNNVMQRLENTAGIEDYLYDIFVLNKKGIIIVSNDKGDIGKDKSQDAYFLDAKEGVFIKDAYVSAKKQLKTISFSAPIVDENGAFLGVVVERAFMQAIDEITTERTGLGKTGEIYLMNKDGYMITPSRFAEDTFLKLKVDTENSRECLQDIKEFGTKPHPHHPIIFKDYRGIKVLGIHQHIYRMQWCLLAKVDTSEIFAPLDNLKMAFIIIVLLLCAGTWIVAGFISRILTEPIHKLHEGTEAIGKGNLNYKVGTDAKDEIGQLSRAFDNMTENLKETTTSITKLNKEVAERKKTEEALRESEEKFRVLYESTVDAVMLLDKNGFFDCNSATLKMFGFSSRDEFVTKHPGELSPPTQPGGESSRTAANKRIETAFEKGENYFEWIHKHADGTLFPVTVRLSRVKLKDKVFLQALVRDITERKKTEEKLKQAAKEWSDTFDAITDLVFIQDKDFKIIKVNKAFADALKVKPDDIIGKKCYEILHKSNKPWPGCPFAKTKKDKKPHTEEVNDPNIGVPLLISTSPIFNKKGELIGSVHIAQDITELKKADEERREAIEVESQFISMASHELRTPLTAIKESIGIVSEGITGKLNAEQKDFLDIAKRNLDRLARLINAVLDYQKLGAGAVKFNIQENDINEVVEEVCSDMLSLAREKGLDLSINLDDKLTKIKFDKDRIIQVLTNIINNAIKFTEKGKIAIATGRRQNGVCVSVQDMGLGIKKGDMPKLFHRFEQLAKSRETKTGGTGLGLAISKEIIEKHKGKIWAESEPGMGTTFYFILPIKERRA